jgi:hypothetical protein
MLESVLIEEQLPTTEGPRSRSNYSMMTVDCPEISNRFRQRMFLQAIMSSFRTM